MLRLPRQWRGRRGTGFRRATPSGGHAMAKGQQSKKDEKKKPEKTLMEKRAEKRAKRAAKG